jgi:hypothetical protein
LLRKIALLIVAFVLVFHPASNIWLVEEKVASGLDTPRVPNFSVIGYDSAGGITS